MQVLATGCNGVPQQWAHWLAFETNSTHSNIHIAKLQSSDKYIGMCGICFNVPFLVWKTCLTGPFLSAGKVIRYLYENGFLFLNVGSGFYCLYTFSFCGKPQPEQLGKREMFHSTGVK